MSGSRLPKPGGMTWQIARKEESRKASSFLLPGLRRPVSKTSRAFFGDLSSDLPSVPGPVAKPVARKFETSCGRVRRAVARKLRRNEIGVSALFARFSRYSGDFAATSKSFVSAFEASCEKVAKPVARKLRESCRKNAKEFEDFESVLPRYSGRSFSRSWPFFRPFFDDIPSDLSTVLSSVLSADRKKSRKQLLSSLI